MKTKVDRVIILKRIRDEGRVSWKIIGRIFKISYTRARQIYFNNGQNNNYPKTTGLKVQPRKIADYTNLYS